MSIDLSRQAAMLPEEHLKQLNVLIVGCGSIGSNAAHVLASMGVERMTLVDGDVVGEENIGPAYFRLSDVERNKSIIMLEEFEDRVTNIYSLPESFSKDTELPAAPYNLVVLGTDNLESRRLAWDMKDEFIDPGKGAIWIEGRMGGPQLSMYSMWTKSIPDCDEYERILFDGTVPPPLPCGMKATAALTKGYVPGFVGQIVFSVVNNRLPPYMQMKDLGDGTQVLLPSKYDGEFRFEMVALPLPD